MATGKKSESEQIELVTRPNALHQLHGMGISDIMANLEIFQPFYVKVQLPHSVKMGETLAVQMVVYNYLEKEISAVVTLENTPDR